MAYDASLLRPRSNYLFDSVSRPVMTDLRLRVEQPSLGAYSVREVLALLATIGLLIAFPKIALWLPGQMR